MKKILILLIPFFLFSGCGKKPNITFCEGVSPDGKGVECGTKFESGDLTAMLKADKDFGTNKIDIVIYELVDNKSIKAESITVTVPPDEVKANINLPLYKGGKFKVKAMNGSEQIGEGEIEILDNL